MCSHPKFRLSIWLRAARCSSSRASSTYKGRRKPEFQKIRRIKGALFIRSAFRRPQIFWILVRLSMSCRRMSRCVWCFSFLLLLAAHIVENTICGTGQQFAKGPCWPLSHHSVERSVLFSAQVTAEGRFRAMSTEPQRTCPSCGNEFSGAMEFCPVCMLHKALAGTAKSDRKSVV